MRRLLSATGKFGADDGDRGHKNKKTVVGKKRGACGSVLSVMDMIHRGRRHHGVSRRHQASLTASVEVSSATDGPGPADAAGGGHCRVLSCHPQTSIAMASVIDDAMPMNLCVAPTSEWSSSSYKDVSSPSIAIGEASRDCSSDAGNCSSPSAYRAFQDMDANRIAASAAGVGFEFDLANLLEELAEADDQGTVLSPTVVLRGSENDGASVSCENVTSFLPVGVTLENLLQLLHASSGETDWTLSLQQRFGNELTQTQLSVINLILINGKNPEFLQGCKSQCSHTSKTANIKSSYAPYTRLTYSKGL
jgi:hypothetical protein